MKTLVMFLLALFAMSPVRGDTAAKPNARPNVLFIAIDDLRPALGCYGDSLAITPQIDKFATGARQFDRAYVQQAVCGPSRTSLLTGLLPDHTQVWHNRNRFRDALPNHVTLPQLFMQNGYRSLAFGKIFSGNKKELDPRSWSEPETARGKNWNNYVLPMNQGKAKKQAAFEIADVPDDAYPDGKLAQLTVRTLEKLKRDGTPFFLAVGFLKPHLPFNAPRKYWELYQRSEFGLPEFLRKPVQLSPELALHTHRELGGYKGVPAHERLDTDQMQLLRHGYYACVSYVDAQVGFVLNALERLQLDRNTIVVVWGDHGFSLGETNRWCKATNFELDTRVPLLIRAPGQSHAGVATDAFVEMVDLYPTLADLVGLETPLGLDGQSFLPVLNDPNAEGRDYVLSQFNRPWTSQTPEMMGYSVRTRDSRYTRWIRWQSRETVAEEVYDYSSDKSVRTVGATSIELANVASDPARRQKIKRLRELLDSALATRCK